MPEFKQILKNTFLKNPNAPAFWLMLGLLVKGTLFIATILNHPYTDIKGVWGAAWGDDTSYILPIENLLNHGIYGPDFRMPGYGAVYLLFRLVFSQAGACNALLIFQLILATASVYYLALTAKNIFEKDTVFYLTFYLFLISSFSNFYDAYIASESLCTSFLIFSAYLFTRYFREHKNKYLLYAGILSTWAMFIRPAFGGIVVICNLLILFQKGTRLNTKIKHLFLFSISFIILEGSWICRNFYVHKKFIPLSSTGGAFYPGAAKTYLEPFFYFVQSWGGVCSFTDKPVDLDWFQYYYAGMRPITHYDSLPDDIYTSAYNKDSLLELKRIIKALQSPSIDTTVASEYQRRLRTSFIKYKFSFEKEKPFTYFLKTPLKIMGVLLYGPETRSYLDRGKSVPFLGELRTAFNRLVYLTLLLCGLIGMILQIIYEPRQKLPLLIVSFIPLYTILIHSWILRLHFNRYLMPAYPFLIICSAYLIYTIYARYFQHSVKA